MMNFDYIPSHIKKRFYWSGIIFFSILIIGTIGYYFIGGKNYSIIDCLYMTSITISTVGFSEIIDMSHNPAGRIFTIFIAFSGIGILTFIFSNVTASIVGGEIQESYKKRKMNKMIESFKDHYIVCGVGRVGSHILRELYATKRQVVAIDNDEKILKEISELYPNITFILGDADSDENLVKAGIHNCKGIFAATGDDNQNLVISLTAKFLNPSVRVIARCLEAVNQEKMKKAGADSVIAENYAAGIRMASEMIRPTIAGMLDKMLTDTERNLRLEEININEKFTGKPILELQLKNFHNTLLMAIISEGDWIYIPKPGHIIKPGSKLIVITTPEERQKLKELS